MLFIYITKLICWGSWWERCILHLKWETSLRDRERVRTRKRVLDGGEDKSKVRCFTQETHVLSWISSVSTFALLGRKYTPKVRNHIVSEVKRFETNVDETIDGHSCTGELLKTTSSPFRDQDLPHYEDKLVSFSSQSVLSDFSWVVRVGVPRKDDVISSCVGRCKVELEGDDSRPILWNEYLFIIVVSIEEISLPGQFTWDDLYGRKGSGGVRHVDVWDRVTFSSSSVDWVRPG